MSNSIDTLEIDGSHGEGGGQIIRTSLALSLITGRPISIQKIRAGRSKPGLQRQHVTAVEAATRIGCAQVSGADIGSSSLNFRPSGIFPGSYRFAVGTAGGATLVLQTILPALMIAESPSQLVLEGGTHNPWAPPFDFLERSYLPLINRLGPKVTMRLERYGFYPAGGGQFSVLIQPTALRGFDLLDRGPLVSRMVTAIVAKIPNHVAEREIATAIRLLGWKPTESQVLNVDSLGPGNVILIEQNFENVCEIATAIGKRGVRAEQVAREAARQSTEYSKSIAPLGEYLTDQWLLPLALAVAKTGVSHSFRCTNLSSHSTTQLETLQRFLPVVARCETGDGKTTVVRISPNDPN